MKARILGVMLGGMIALSGSGVLAAYPDRPVHLYVGFDAGTSMDLSARQLTPKLSEVLGQNIIVDNHGGANGIIATEIVAKAPADGYSLLFGSSGHAANPSLYKTLPYDAVKDFTPIGRVDTQYFVLVVSASSTVKSLADLIALAKKQPGKLNFASTGTGSTAQLAGTLFDSIEGLDVTAVPYTSASQALVELIGGQVSFMFYTYINLQPMIAAGKLRAIAVTGPQREASMPDVPTMQEAGVKDFLISTWHGLYGPAKLPGDIVAKLNGALAQTLKDPEVQGRMAKAGVSTAPQSPADFADFTKAEIDRYKKIAVLTGVKPE